MSVVICVLWKDEIGCYCWIGFTLKSYSKNSDHIKQHGHELIHIKHLCTIHLQNFTDSCIFPAGQYLMVYAMVYVSLCVCMSQCVLLRLTTLPVEDLVTVRLWEPDREFFCFHSLPSSVLMQRCDLSRLQSWGYADLWGNQQNHLPWMLKTGAAGRAWWVDG